MLETFRSFFDPPITADPEQSTAKLAWVVRLRWVAIAAQVVVIAPALEFQLLEPKMLPLFLFVSGLVAIFGFGLGERRLGEESAYTVFNNFRALPGQMGADEIQRQVARGL